MSDFDPEQAKQRLRELDDLRNRQIDENPFLLHKLRRGDYDFHVDADWDIRELQKDAESNGYYLYVDLDYYGLARKKEVYTESGKRISSIDLMKELTARKHTDLPWLKDWGRYAK